MADMPGMAGMQMATGAAASRLSDVPTGSDQAPQSDHGHPHGPCTCIGCGCCAVTPAVIVRPLEVVLAIAARPTAAPISHPVATPRVARRWNPYLPHAPPLEA
jgi:hypothetical protein